MDDFVNPNQPASPPRPHRLRLSQILAYERADTLSGGLLLFMVVFTPWAFGTTQPWAIWTMNLSGYVLGGLLVFKWWMRFYLGYSPLRWDGPFHRQRALTGVLLGVTALLLGYVLVAAVNGRADYDPARLTFTYREHLSWLPGSYDRDSTWSAWANYLAWACAFWSFRDWLLGKSERERRVAQRKHQPENCRISIPDRLRMVLWFLALNGAALGIEGIIQRLEGSGKLLFLIKPRVNPGAEAQFGPFAYRSNAIQYLNMVWPVTLGFWWWLRQSVRRQTPRFARHHWLLVCATIMAACPIISTSRAGALTGMALLAFSVIVLISGKHGDGLVKLAVLGVFGLSLAGGLYFGWQSLNPRLDQLAEGHETRELIYKTARIIAQENPVFGTGPGTFESIFQLYRQSLTEYWPAQLHNDWLEILLTFGWVGFSLSLLALLLVVAHWWSGGGIVGSQRFIWLVWLALGGCLLQARWDFPFQIYSVVFLFLSLCAVLTVVNRPPLTS